jgi:hypothetical protein
VGVKVLLTIQYTRSNIKGSNQRHNFGHEGDDVIDNEDCKCKRTNNDKLFCPLWHTDNFSLHLTKPYAIPWNEYKQLCLFDKQLFLIKKESQEQ